MKVFKIFTSNKHTLLAMGPESDGNFSILKKNIIYYFNGFGDLLNENNFKKYKKFILDYLNKKNLKPDIILVDLHPLFNTTQFGEKLSKKYKARLIQTQHHYAHTSSAVIDEMFAKKKIKADNNFLGIASDGTGYGLDGNIWGGEIIEFKNKRFKRIGSLEEQILLGGDLAIKQPARMLLSILLKIIKKDKAWKFVKKYFKQQDFNILTKQYEQKFNCHTTSSTARVLDAISVLLGFSVNKREYKHQPISFLEKNSGKAYVLNPKIYFDPKFKRKIISTSYLFKYLLNNLNLNKKRLAATAQLYLAKGFYNVAKKNNSHKIYFAGGMANNKIMAEYLNSKNVYINKKIPRGDQGISLGQIGYYLLTNSRN